MPVLATLAVQLSRCSLRDQFDDLGEISSTYFLAQEMKDESGKVAEMPESIVVFSHLARGQDAFFLRDEGVGNI